MATLNIKNMPDPLYRRLRMRAKEEHRSIAQEVIQLLEEAMQIAESSSILKLKGLGKELWKEIDTKQHVNRERASWD